MRLSRAFINLLFAVLLLLLVACSHDQGMEQLDHEVDSMIHAEKTRSLGVEADRDSDPLSPRNASPIDSSSPAYRKTPPSYNPALADLNIPPQSQPADSQPDLPSTQSATTQSATTQSMLDQSAPGDDPNPTPMDLTQVLAYAIEHSPDYRGHKDDLFATTITLLIQRHLWGPIFFDDVTAQATGTPEAGDHDQALSVINQFGVTQRLPSGGSIAASAVVGLVDFVRKRSANNATNPDKDFGLNLTATIPLLRGSGPSAQEGLIQAERDMVYAVRTFERYRRTFFVDISTRYYDLMRMQSEIHNLDQQVENLNWLKRRTERLAIAGRQPYFEVQRAEQQVLFAQNNVINERETYQVALDELKLVIGMPIPTRLEIRPMEVVLPVPSLEPQSALSAAMRCRLDLQTALDRTDDSRRKIEVARNMLLPDLNAFATVLYNSDQYVPVPNEPLGDLGVSQYATGVTLGIPLDRRAEELGFRQAIINHERSQRDYAVQRDRVLIDVRQSLRQIQQARTTVDLQERNIQISDKRLRGVLLRFGELGPRDYIEAQNDLLDALNRRDTAVRDLRVSILQFLLSTDQMRVSSDGSWEPPASLIAPAPAIPQPTPAQIISGK